MVSKVIEAEAVNTAVALASRTPTAHRPPVHSDLCLLTSPALAAATMMLSAGVMREAPAAAKPTASAAAEKQVHHSHAVDDVSSGVDDDFEPVYPDIDGADVSKKKLDSLFNKAVEVCAKAQEVPMDERTAFHVERARRAKGVFKEIIDLCLKRTHALDREILHAGLEEEEERPVGEAKQEKVKVMLMEGKVLANLGTMYGTEGRVKVAHHKFVRAIELFNQLGNATFEKLALERAVSNCVSPLYRNYREGIRMAKRQQKLAKKMKNRADEELLEEHIGTFKEALRRENSDKRVVRLMEGGREMYVLSQRDEGEGKLAQQASHFHPGLTRARATAAGGGESKGAGGSRGGGGGSEFGGGDAPNKVSRLVEFEGPKTMQVR